MTFPKSPVDPVCPPAAYIGGKRNLSRRLVNLIDAIPHQLYGEAFVGMGGIFFRRTRRPNAEVINDISNDITTLFRILQRHYQPFMDMLKWRLSDRAEFERLLRIDPTTCTDLERAARFLYLQRIAFGGKVVGRNFGVSYDTPSRFRFSAIELMLDRVYRRLETVVIERMHYTDFLKRYGRKGSLIYLDPPYWGSTGDYGSEFSERDFEIIREILHNFNGKFVMSINDTPEIREIFSSLAAQEIEVTYQISERPMVAKELIICGP